MKIHVNVTTWVKRDLYLPIMLKAFAKQTLKPDKIILWLSHEEYDLNNLPDSILECINKKLITDLMWVDKNIYCHKRHECFKYYNNVYNIFIDDDIIYPINFLEELILASKNNPECITCTASYAKYYNGTKITMDVPTKNPSFVNGPMGCWMCIPPNTFPLESYEYSDQRDKYCPKCDEGWLMAWCLKKNIKINIIHYINDYRQINIDKSQESALYNENKLTTDGVRIKERMLANAIKIVGAEKEAKKVWPNFDINASSSADKRGNINELIICALTSWEKRISNIPITINSILNNYMLPDKIILTLSEDEFKNKKLPVEVLHYIDNHSIILINWVKENTKVWKKLLPVFELYPTDCIICIDDDRVYDPNFIRSLWFKHLLFPNNPISLAITLVGGNLQHCGSGTLDKLDYYGDVLQIIKQYPEIMKLRSSDTFFEYMAAYNGNPCIQVGNSIPLLKPYNEVAPYKTTFEEIKLCLIFLNLLFNTNYGIEIIRPQKKALKNKKIKKYNRKLWI